MSGQRNERLQSLDRSRIQVVMQPTELSTAASHRAPPAKDLSSRTVKVSKWKSIYSRCLAFECLYFEQLHHDATKFA